MAKGAKSNSNSSLNDMKKMLGNMLNDARETIGMEADVTVNFTVDEKQSQANVDKAADNISKPKIEGEIVIDSKQAKAAVDKAFIKGTKPKIEVEVDIAKKNELKQKLKDLMKGASYKFNENPTQDFELEKNIEIAKELKDILDELAKVDSSYSVSDMLAEAKEGFDKASAAASDYDRLLSDIRKGSRKWTFNSMLNDVDGFAKELNELTEQYDELIHTDNYDKKVALNLEARIQGMLSAQHKIWEQGNKDAFMSYFTDVQKQLTETAQRVQDHMWEAMANGRNLLGKIDIETAVWDDLGISDNRFRLQFDTDEAKSFYEMLQKISSILSYGPGGVGQETFFQTEMEKSYRIAEELKKRLESQYQEALDSGDTEWIENQYKYIAQYINKAEEYKRKLAEIKGEAYEMQTATAEAVKESMGLGAPKIEEQADAFEKENAKAQEVLETLRKIKAFLAEINSDEHADIIGFQDVKGKDFNKILREFKNFDFNVLTEIGLSEEDIEHVRNKFELVLADIAHVQTLGRKASRNSNFLDDYLNEHGQPAEVEVIQLFDDWEHAIDRVIAKIHSLKQEQADVGTSNSITSVKEFFEQFGSVSDAINRGAFANLQEFLSEYGHLISELDLTGLTEKEVNVEFAKELVKQLDLTEEEVLVVKSLLQDIENLSPGGVAENALSETNRTIQIADDLEKIFKIADGTQFVSDEDVANAKQILGIVEDIADENAETQEIDTKAARKRFTEQARYYKNKALEGNLLPEDAEAQFKRIINEMRELGESTKHVESVFAEVRNALSMDEVVDDATKGAETVEEEAEAFEENAKGATEAAKAKEDFNEANKQTQKEADKGSENLDEETKSAENLSDAMRKVAGTSDAYWRNQTDKGNGGLSAVRRVGYAQDEYIDVSYDKNGNVKVAKKLKTDYHALEAEIKKVDKAMIQLISDIDKLDRNGEDSSFSVENLRALERYVEALEEELYNYYQTQGYLPDAFQQGTFEYVRAETAEYERRNVKQKESIELSKEEQRVNKEVASTSKGLRDADARAAKEVELNRKATLAIQKEAIKADQEQTKQLLYKKSIQDELDRQKRDIRQDSQNELLAKRTSLLTEQEDAYKNIWKVRGQLASLSTKEGNELKIADLVQQEKVSQQAVANAQRKLTILDSELQKDGLITDEIIKRDSLQQRMDQLHISAQKEILDAQNKIKNNEKAQDLYATQINQKLIQMSEAEKAAAIEANRKNAATQKQAADVATEKEKQQLLTQERNIYGDILDVTGKIAKLESQKGEHSSDLSVLKQQKKVLQQQFIAIEKQISGYSNVLSLSERLKVASDARLKIERQLAQVSDSYVTELQKLKDNTDSLSVFNNPRLTTSVKAQVNDFKIAIDNALNSGNIDRNVIDAFIASFERLKREATDTGNILAKETRITELYSKVAAFLDNNSAMAKNFKVELKDILSTLSSGAQLTDKELDGIAVRFNKVSGQVRELHQTGNSLFTSFIKQLKSSNAQLLATYFSLQDIIRYLREGFQTVLQVDTALTELRKVSDASDERLAQSFKQSTITAKELGSTISDVIGVTADWARLGYNVDEAEELARVTTLFKTVGDNMTAEDTSSYLISTLQGFQLETERAEEIADKFNEVANNYAIDTAGIGEALQRSAASFNAANTDLSESIALITAANTVVQNPESVGTLWKTMSARIRGAKTELAELDEEEDEFTQTTSKLQSLVKGLTGFDVLEEDGKTFKSIYDIIIGIGKEWKNLTDIEQASLGEALAGRLLPVHIAICA